MPTRLTIKNRKFFRELENGSRFNLNRTSYANHLKGSVMDKVKMTCEVELYTQIIIQSYNQGANGTDYFIEKENLFVNSGLWTGDEILIRSVGGNTFGTITSIDDNRMDFTYTSGYTLAKITYVIAVVNGY